MEIVTICCFRFKSAMVGSVVLSSILAVDADQPGPYSTVQYSILPGPHSVKKKSNFIIYDWDRLEVQFFKMDQVTTVLHQGHIIIYFLSKFFFWKMVRMFWNLPTV